MTTTTQLVQLIIEADKESDNQLLLLNTTFHRMDRKDTPAGEENTEERMDIIRDYLIGNDGDMDNVEEVFDLVFDHQFDETDGFKDVYVPFYAEKGDFATTEVAEFTFDNYKEVEEDINECLQEALDGDRLDDIDSLIETAGTNFGYNTHEEAVISKLRDVTGEEYGRMFAVNIYTRRYGSGNIVNEGKDFECDDYGDSSGPDTYVFFNQCLWTPEDFETFILSDMEKTIEIKNKIMNISDEIVSPLYKKVIARSIEEGGVIESVDGSVVEMVKYMTDENQQPNSKSVGLTDIINQTVKMTSYDIQNDVVLYESEISNEDLKGWLAEV